MSAPGPLDPSKIFDLLVTDENGFLHRRPSIALKFIPDQPGKAELIAELGESYPVFVSPGADTR